MGHSALCDIVKISPCRTSPRNRPIDTITIHCTAGLSTGQALADMFSKLSRNASCNYAIGADGKIVCCVDENDRSWCSSNAGNDHRAITIEVASESKEPYAVSEYVMARLVGLLVDICQRNHIPELRWKNDKSLLGNTAEQNITLHRWFANTACPGQYIIDHLPNIVTEVNNRLPGQLYRVQVGAFSDLKNAEAMLQAVQQAGFSAVIVHGE